MHTLTKSEDAVMEPAPAVRRTENLRGAPPTSAVVPGASSSPSANKARRGSARTGSTAALRAHWPEYLMEAAGLGLFMFSACAFGALLLLPASPVVKAIATPTIRRVMFGFAMAGTLIAIIYSPIGAQSGAHLNPSVTLTFFRLKKIRGWDAVFYIASQFLGGLAGVLIAVLIFGDWIRHPAVHYVVTVPGPDGPWPAFMAEFVMAVITMTVVLRSSNHPVWSRYTGLLAGALVAAYISFEAPISGFSLNPARTTASAAPAMLWTAAWIYFTAPPLGMLVAAEAYLVGKGHDNVFCAKLHHHNNKRCIFNCRFGEMQAQGPQAKSAITN